MSKLQNKLARCLVAIANHLIKKNQLSHYPVYRPVDTYIPGIGHKYSCGAYSYEHLKSLVEQDGPDGFGATATIAWLISEDGWREVSDMDETELRRTLAMSGIDTEDL